MLFDDIRPYTDQEIPDAMRRIAESPFLPTLAAYVFPQKTTQEVAQMLLSYNTINDFQIGVMYHVNKQIIQKSITELTYSGIEHLEKDKPYLFVSNHRDIMLDASLLQNILVDNQFKTTQITFGANLMTDPLVVDIGKSNKMFRVERPGDNSKEFYNSSLHLSQYIRHAITEQKESVWIAQRNGRTKDGNDQTDQGIIKMFCMSQSKDKLQALAQLNIAPIAVSYEWESCDFLKAAELEQSKNGKYVKKPGEDLNSILTGILQPKGRVHFHFCKPLTREELKSLTKQHFNNSTVQQFNNSTVQQFNKHVALLIDQRIHEAYKLWPNNYIAHDLLHNQQQYIQYYTPEEKAAFQNHISTFQHFNVSTLLSIYANPVNNKYNPET